MFAKDAPPTYAETLMDCLAHSPVAPSKGAGAHQPNITKPEDPIEPKLVAIVTKYGPFRPHPPDPSFNGRNPF